MVGTSAHNKISISLLVANQIGTYAGGGGQSSYPGGNGGDGGKPGSYPLNKAPHCYDKTAQGGNAGSAVQGGGGGTGYIISTY